MVFGIEVAGLHAGLHGTCICCHFDTIWLCVTTTKTDMLNLNLRLMPQSMWINDSSKAGLATLLCSMFASIPDSTDALLCLKQGWVIHVQNGCQNFGLKVNIYCSGKSCPGPKALCRADVQDQMGAYTGPADSVQEWLCLMFAVLLTQIFAPRALSRMEFCTRGNCLGRKGVHKEAWGNAS